MKFNTQDAAIIVPQVTKKITDSVAEAYSGEYQ